jgi:PAS domain S-box-containing protein
MKNFVLFFLLLNHFIYASEINSQNTITIGILSCRDLNANQKAWKPLEEYLNNFTQIYQYKIQSYPQDDLEQVIATNQVDILIADSVSSVMMETKYRTHNIASVVKKGLDGQLLTSYGSVIVVKSNRDDINVLEDVKNKKVAISNKSGLETYLIAKNMLEEIKLDIDKDCDLVITGQPMDKVWEALHSGKADVGVFRTGYLEELIAKGKLKQSDIKVIDPKKEEGFDYMLSSKLYPEWAVIASNNVSDEAVKMVTVGLYSIKESNCSEYDSFSLPSSYASTREMMRKYHIYPFNKIQFCFSQFLEEYFLYIVIFMGVIVLFSWFFVYYYIKTSQKLKEDSEQLNTILTTASDGIHVLDKEGKFIFFSDAFHTMLGYTREEMSKLTVFDLEKRTTRHGIISCIDDVMSSGKVLRFEAKHAKKDGTIMDIELIINGITLNNEHYLYAVSRDITELKKQQKLLKEQKKEFETIFESSQDGIAVLDLESKFLRVNGAYTTILGLTKEELLQTTCIALSIPEDIEKTKQIFKDIADGFSIENFEKYYNVNGKNIIVSISLSLMPDKQHILASVKNISHKKLFEAQSKLAAMGEMIGNITHQWRQPLSVISTIASGIQFRYEIGTLQNYQSTGDDMETIMVQIDYLSRTIEDFRDFIRGDVSRQEVYTKRLIEKTIAIVGASMKKNDIAILLNNDGDFSFDGYENELVQAFLNIINNAKDAIVENLGINEDKYIFINISNKDGNSIEFLDNGGGINDAILPKIFESYFTTKPKDIGTGIGLSMTQQIVTEHHNAKIEVSNKEYEYNGNKWKGASFKIFFLS